MFDPYHKWLGIPKEQRPPTFYQLLGIAPTEQDPDVIEEAAIRQTTHVRAYQIGPHAAECTRLLNEIAQARQVLLNPSKRREYDQTLARKTGPSKEVPPAAARQMVTTVPAAPPRTEFEELEEAPLARASARSRQADLATGGNKGLIIGLSVCGGVLAILAVVLIVVLGGGGRDNNKNEPPPLAQKKQEPEPLPVPDPPFKRDGAAEPEPPPVKPKPPDPNPPEPPPLPVAQGPLHAKLLHQDKTLHRTTAPLFFPDGERVLFYLSYGEVAHGPIEDWDKAEKFRLPERVDRPIALSPDARRVLFLKSNQLKDDADGTYQAHDVLVWNLETGQVQTRFSGQKSTVASVAFSPDGQWVLTAGSRLVRRDQKIAGQTSHVCIWHLTLGMERKRWDDAFPPVVAASFSLDGTKIFLVCRDGTIREVDLDGGNERVLHSNGRKYYSTAQFSPNGRYLLTSEITGVRQFTLEPFAEGAALQWPPLLAQSLAVSADNRFGLVGLGSPNSKANDAFAVLVDLATGKELARTAPGSHIVIRSGVSPGGKYAVTQDNLGTCSLWAFGREDQLAALPARKNGEVPKKSEEPPKNVEPPKQVEPPKKEPPKEEPPEPPKIAKLLPVPDEAARKEKEKEILEQYKKDFAKKSPADRAALAERLLTVGTVTRDDMTARYAVLCLARDLAGQAGKTELALRAVEELTRDFAIDPLEGRHTALLAVSKGTALGKDGARDLLEAATAAASEAVAAEQFALAFQFLGIAKAAAGRTPNPAAFANQVQKHDKYVRDTAREYDAMKAATPTLEKTPDHAEANLAVGRYLALRKGDWDKGLPFLGRGGDGPLPALARADLKNPDDPKDRTELGDQWWTAAEKDTSGVKSALQWRAGHWYRLALPQLSGLTQDRIAARIKLVDEQPEPFKVVDRFAEIRRHKAHSGAATCLTLSPDGKRVVSGGADGNVSAWDPATGKSGVLINAGMPVQTVAASADGRYLAVCSDRLLRVFDLVTKKIAPRFRERESLPGAAWVGPDSVLQITSSTAWTHNVEKGNGSGSQLQVTPTGLVVAPDQRFGVVLSRGSVSLHSISRPVGFFPTGNDLPIDPVAAAFSPDGTMLAVSGRDKSIHLVDVARRQQTKTFPAPGVRCLAFSPKGNYLLTGGSDRTLRLWDVASGKELYRATQAEPAQAVLVAADGRSAFSAGGDGIIRQWNLPREK